MHTCSKWVCRLIQIIPCSICLAAYFGRQHPSLPLRKTGKNLKWTFLLIANASELLEVKAKASMCHPLLTHGKKFDIKDFQSLRCSIFKKSYNTDRVQQLIKKVTLGSCYMPGRGERELNHNHIPCFLGTTLPSIHILPVPWLASMPVSS